MRIILWKRPSYFRRWSRPSMSVRPMSVWLTLAGYDILLYIGAGWGFKVFRAIGRGAS